MMIAVGVCLLQAHIRSETEVMCLKDKEIFKNDTIVNRIQ